MGSVATYRSLVPTHGNVPTATIEAWLTQAAAALSPVAFGARYEFAAIMWAAAHVEPYVAIGMYTPNADGSICAPLPTPESGAVLILPQNTQFWQSFLATQNSRVATAPFFVSSFTRCVR